MIRNISIGIDVGSFMTRVVVGEFEKGEKNPKIIGMGEAQSSGLRHGYVVNSSLAAESIELAVIHAEKTSGLKIRRAFLALSGVSLRGDVSLGSAIISKADSEVTSLDVTKALEDSENNLNLNNKKVIQVFPISYRLDGKEVMGRLEGMRGNKLEVKALFVTYSLPHLEDLMEAMGKAGVEVIDIIASPVAASHLALSEKQKIVGGALLDIGAEKVTLSVFENGSLVSLHSFSIGAEDITNDIALGLKIPLEKAAEYKLGGGGDYSKKKLDEIIEARLSDIFELVENHLKKIKRSGLLPAGLIFVGGGASTLNIETTARNFLKLPAKIASTEFFGANKTKLRDPAWFNALGTVIMSKESDSYGSGSFFGFFKDIKNAVNKSLKQLMP